MTCVHKVRWSVKRPEDCRFRLSVSHYKDRIVAPAEYTGAIEVTPSDDTQVLATKDKTVRANITVNPAPVESLATSENGTFTPSSGKVGFSQVNVDVQPDLHPLSVSENGTYEPEGFDGYSSVTADIEPNLTSLSVTENGLYLPDTGVDGFDRVSVDVAQKWDINAIADGSVSGQLVLDTATSIRVGAFRGTAISGVDAPKVDIINSSAFYGCKHLSNVKFLTCKTIGSEAFRENGGAYGADSDFVSDFPAVVNIGTRAFQNCNFEKVILPPTAKVIGDYPWSQNNNLIVICFTAKPDTMTNALASSNPNLSDVYVPWSEGEVSGAPWRATSATIHYNTVYDSDWNVISST